jgi:hypothetical protein
VEIDLYLKNAHTFSSRDMDEEELESDAIYHYLLEVFKALYGRNVTSQWHYGDGPDCPSTSVHMSIDAFRKGIRPTSIFLNILAARIYRRHLATLTGRGVLFAIVDDVKISASHAVIAEIVDTFSGVAWHEVGLTTQVVKNKIYVQPTARARLSESTPRDSIAALPIHDIPDVSYLTNPSDPESARLWPQANGIDILGTPLGTPDFIEAYLFKKGIKHRQLLCFIHEVVVSGFPREAVSMLTGAASPSLTHLLKFVEKSPRTES